MTKPQNLQIILANLEGTVVVRTETRIEATAPQGTLVTEAQVDVVPASEVALISGRV